MVSKGQQRRLGRHERVRFGLRLQGLRRHVQAIGTRDRPGLRVELHLRKVPRVSERLEDSCPLFVGEVHIAYRAVIEEEPQNVVV
jgi:hypothetical protein